MIGTARLGVADCRGVALLGAARSQQARRSGDRRASSSARPARARAPRRRSSPSGSGCRSSPPATCSGPPSATGTPLGLEARRYMDARPARARRHHRPHAARPAGPARRRRRRDPRRLPPDRGAGAARSTRPSPSTRRRASTGDPDRRPARRSSIRRMSGSLGLPGGGPRLPRDVQPAPATPGVCDIDGSQLVPARRRPAGDDPRPDGPAAARRSTRSSTTTGRSGVLRTVDGLQAIDEVADGSPPPSRTPSPPGSLAGDAHGRLMHVTRKSQAEIAKMRSRRPDRRGGPGAGRGEPRSRASSTAELDRLAEAPHPRRQGRAVVPQLPRRSPLRRARPARLPGVDLHLDRRRDRPRDPGRPRDQGGPDRVGRRRRDLRRLARRRRAHASSCGGDDAATPEAATWSTPPGSR